jgi:hypothetical protein
MKRDKFYRRECEVCERRLTRVRLQDGRIVGDCPIHGIGAAWITGIRQNALDAMEGGQCAV